VFYRPQALLFVRRGFRMCCPRRSIFPRNRPPVPPYCPTAMVTVFEVAPPMFIWTGTASVADAASRTWALNLIQAGEARHQSAE